MAFATTVGEDYGIQIASTSPTLPLLLPTNDIDLSCCRESDYLH
jgi:hypothetical protein